MSAAGVLTVQFTRKLSTGDANDYAITNSYIDVSWAFGALSGNVPGYHGGGANRGDEPQVNLFTGGSIAAPFSVDPALQLMIGVVGVSFLYFVARVINKILKHFKRMDHSDAKRLLTTSVDDLSMMDVPIEEPEEVFGNPSGAYYFRGSVAVPYKSKHQKKDETNEVVGLKGSMNDIRSSLNKFNQHHALSQDEIQSAFLSTLAPEKKTDTTVANFYSKVVKARIPKSHIAVGDIMLTIAFLGLNFAILAYFSLPKYVVGLTWGYLATANMLLVALPATRNSVLVWALGVPFDKSIMYHRWLGRLAILQSCVHWYYYWGKQSLYGMKYWYGVYAWIGLAVIFVTSINWLRRHHFNIFFGAHFAFVPMYLLGALHSVAVFKYYALTAAAIYGLDRVIRFFWGAFPKKTLSVEIISGAVRVRFPKNWLASYTVGQYVFVNFPQIGFLEWHPFTLASGPDENCSEIMIKSLGDHTRKLMHAAQSRETLWIRVDGPYGNWPFNFFRYKCAVLVAGGVGVTPSIATIRHIYNLHRSSQNEVEPYLSDLFFIWSCKSEQEYEWYKADVEAAIEKSALKNQKYPTLHLHIHVTSPKDPENLPAYLKSGRPDVSAVFDRVEHCGEDTALRVAVVACGPAVMVNEAWDQCSKRTGRKHRFDFHHETFEF
eukprot:TRINITY_DN5728_c0_g4_i1.p1 TRINITY_DN5728_c0_g4~~TRINITY_DN5728_c0_g4_i1.p1  ORF type:complete len:675 (-),score=152.69 TRINITY_DN5728_c0_g4_i1:32-2011(-)